MKNEKFEEHLTSFKKWNECTSHDMANKQRKLFIKAIIKTFFHRGDEGLEIANYFADTPNPYTAKKIRCIRGECHEKLNEFIFDSK